MKMDYQMTSSKLLRVPRITKNLKLPISKTKLLNLNLFLALVLTTVLLSLISKTL
mgnify:CR=1 FL=1